MRIRAACDARNPAANAVHCSVRGLGLGVDQRRERGIGHRGAAHVEQEVEDLGRGDEVAAREPLQCFVDQS